MELLKIPSISADPNYKDEIKKTAHWIKNALKMIGCDNVKIYNTEGHPIVYGEISISENVPTVLVYGHYDVQPPDPLELWGMEMLSMPCSRKLSIQRHRFSGFIEIRRENGSSGAPSANTTLR